MVYDGYFTSALKEYTKITRGYRSSRMKKGNRKKGATARVFIIRGFSRQNCARTVGEEIEIQHRP